MLERYTCPTKCIIYFHIGLISTPTTVTLERTIYHFEQFKDHFSPLDILKFMIEKTVAPVLLLGGDDSVRGAKVLL